MYCCCCVAGIRAVAKAPRSTKIGPSRPRQPEGWSGERCPFVFGGVGMTREGGGTLLVDGVGWEYTILDGT